jgi:hypothetical protein
MAFAVSTGHLNHPNLRGEFETKGYVKSLSKKRMWGGRMRAISGSLQQGTQQDTHLTSYNIVKIKWSLGVIKIAGRDKHMSVYEFVTKGICEEK